LTDFPSSSPTSTRSCLVGGDVNSAQPNH
jgi:hypothetical protein